jgi:hypothetical protein
VLVASFPCQLLSLNDGFPFKKMAEHCQSVPTSQRWRLT